MLRDNFCPEIARLLAADEWLLAQEGYQPADNLAWESRFCLASGYMSSRGAHVCGTSRPSLPATYVHGVFDRSEAFMRELVNTPDWARLRVYADCEQIGVEGGKIEGYLRVLDMRSGLLATRYEHVGACGRTRVEQLKLVSRAHPQIGLIRLYLTPLDGDRLFELENVVDATVTNFMDYPRFRTRHFTVREVAYQRGGFPYVECETRDFRLPICTMTAVAGDGIGHRDFRPYGETACEFFDVRAARGQTARVDKFAAVATGRETDGVRWRASRLLQDALDRGADAEIAAHAVAYEALWDVADIVIDGDERIQHALRFNIFHLMSTPSARDDRVNVGAKLMHGEEYGGHAFWDTELFTLPFFTHVFPDIARNLVRYRGHLLEEARENARACGYRGAKFPWESADTGDEECPSWTVDYDGSCYRCYVADYEHHVTAAVAYGLRAYVRATGDERLMEDFGLELLLETARFWASRMTWNADKARYEILRVTGPDEWHEPVDNNEYTNRLAKWNIEEALACLAAWRARKPEFTAALEDKLGISEREISELRDRADRVYLHAQTGLIEQFDGYFAIPDAVIDRWDERGMPLMPESCRGKRGMERPILKQADVVMLMKLLPDCYDLQTQRENFAYYEKRTLHRSSLSPSMHALMGLRVGDDARAYQYLERSAYVDLEDNQRNTREGLHAASMGGTWQCVVMGFCDMRVSDGGELIFSPKLPDAWRSVRFTLFHRGERLRVRVDRSGARVEKELR